MGGRGRIKRVYDCPSLAMLRSNRKDAQATPAAPTKMGSHTHVASLSTPKAISPTAPDTMLIMRKVAETRPKTVWSTPVCSMMEEVICIGIAEAMVRQSRIVIATTDTITGITR